MALTDKLTAIANAIRTKTGNTGALTLEQMASEVEGISTGVPINNQNKTITQNGTYTADEGFTGLGTVSVNVAKEGQTDIEEQWRRLLEGDASKPVTMLPSGLTKIKNNAFAQNKALKLTSLPDSVTSIGDNAFLNCSNIALTSLPSGLTSIGISAFSNCWYITLTSLPDGLTSIGQNTFNYCSRLALTSLPDSVTSIGDGAFYYCEKLAITSIPSGVTSIGSSFTLCYGLKEITFEGKPNSISDGAFNGCKNLLTINVPWAEGEVANAPWGATNATINYNYTGE